MNIDQVIVRSATLEDLPILLRFEQGVIDAERPFDVTLKSANARYYNLEELIMAPHIEMAVAEVDGNIIASGYARIQEAKSYSKFEKYAFLGFMFVDPKYRGQGLNKKIIDHLKAWIRSKDIDELRLEVYVENEGAIRAYEKIGFSTLLYEMRMNLKDEK